VVRPKSLQAIPLDEALSRGRVVTMSRGQWDALLAAAYDAGWTLLEVDDCERPVRAFRKWNPSDEDVKWLQ
jgi:hypothetical protein